MCITTVLIIIWKRSNNKYISVEAWSETFEKLALIIATSNDIEDGQQYVFINSKNEDEEEVLEIHLIDEESKIPGVYFKACTLRYDNQNVVKPDEIDFTFYDTRFEELKGEVLKEIPELKIDKV